MQPPDPPAEVRLDLEEALELLATLEDASYTLADSDRLALLAQLEHQIAVLNRKLGFGRRPGGGDDAR